MTTDVNDWIRPITVVVGAILPSVDFPDWTEAVSVAAQGSSGFALIVENVNTVAASGAAQTVPDPTVDTISWITLTASCTFTFPTAVAGKSFLVGLLQGGVGSFGATWPGTVKWAAGVAPTLTVTAGKADLFAFLCLDGTHWLGITGGQNF